MYWLAATARGKLQREADRDDHNLRLLVGHANLLDKVLPKLEVDEQGIEVHVIQSKDDPGGSESLHKTTIEMSLREQRVSVILNKIDWSEYEDDDIADEAHDEFENDDDEYIANGVSSSLGRERLDFGVPLHRTKTQTVVCVNQTFGEVESENPIESSRGHDSDLVHLESTLDVLKMAETIREIEL